MRVVSAMLARSLRLLLHAERGTSERSQLIILATRWRYTTLTQCGCLKEC